MAEQKRPRRRLKAAKPTERATLWDVRRLMDPSTGEEMKCLVPFDSMDRKLVNEMQLRVGDIVVADVFKERNRKFYGLWHKLAEFVAANTEKYNGLRSHDMLKKLQLDSRVHCELRDFILEDGTVIQHWAPKSLNFFDTDETQAQVIWESICDYVARSFFFDWTADQVAEAAEYWERQT